MDASIHTPLEALEARVKELEDRAAVDRITMRIIREQLTESALVLAMERRRVLQAIESLKLGEEKT